MGSEMPVKWFDDVYQNQIDTDGWYTKVPSLSSMLYNVWMAAIADIDDNAYVADFGCGTGQFVYLLLNNNKKVAYGVDFSSVSIGMAKKLNGDKDHLFYIGNLLHDDVYSFCDYQVATFIEVLKNFHNDIDVISHIPSGVKVIFTYPNYDYDSHVRWFTNIGDIENRYNGLLDIIKVTVINRVDNPNKKFYVVVGIKS